MTAPPPERLDRLRHACRVRHLSPRTEGAGPRRPTGAAERRQPFARGGGSAEPLANGCRRSAAPDRPPTGGPRLRVKDVDFAGRQLVVRHGKGGKDRRTLLPAAVRDVLAAHLERVRELHARDVAGGWGRVWLPDALAVKFLRAAGEWAWQWVFPAARRWTDPATGDQRRHHTHESAMTRAVASAVRASGITVRATSHTFRHSSATHLLEAGCDTRTVRELPGRAHVGTTRIDRHVLNRGGRGMTSPLDPPPPRGSRQRDGVRAAGDGRRRTLFATGRLRR